MHEAQLNIQRQKEPENLFPNKRQLGKPTRITHISSHRKSIQISMYSDSRTVFAEAHGSYLFTHLCHKSHREVQNSGFRLFSEKQKVN